MCYVDEAINNDEPGLRRAVASFIEQTREQDKSTKILSSVLGKLGTELRSLGQKLLVLSRFFASY